MDALLLHGSPYSPWHLDFWKVAHSVSVPNFEDPHMNWIFTLTITAATFFGSYYVPKPNGNLYTDEGSSRCGTYQDDSDDAYSYDGPTA
jgi:hypothetical protein